MLGYNIGTSISLSTDPKSREKGRYFLVHVLVLTKVQQGYLFICNYGSTCPIPIYTNRAVYILLMNSLAYVEIFANSNFGFPGSAFSAIGLNPLPSSTIRISIL